MKVGEKLAEQTASEVSASKSASEKRQQSSKKSGRKRKNLGPRQSAVQRLFETCKEVFANGGPGIVPSPEDVDRLRSILDNVDASDVGLTPKMPYFRHGASEGRPPITYLHIYKCDKFSICIFCLPPSGVIPLHNHPGMTVFSKLLFGSLHVKSYDWVNLPQDSAEIVDPLHSVQPPGLRLAKVKTDGTYTAPCRTSVLFPQDGGNLHCFTARTSCAVLDVLGPPYSNPEEGRDCTYYNDSPYASFCGDAELLTDDGEYAWLEERKKPDEFIVVGANYSGPKIMDQ